MSCDRFSRPSGTALSAFAPCRYGCLGFSNSRFFARPLAELVTSQGRAILQATVDLVQNTLGLEVGLGREGCVQRQGVMRRGWAGQGRGLMGVESRGQGHG